MDAAVSDRESDVDRLTLTPTLEKLRWFLLPGEVAAELAAKSPSDHTSKPVS
jgi:hypothetical protein